MQLLAKDGVFLPTAPRDITQGLLASGNRADVLINCPAGDDFIFESRPFPSCVPSKSLPFCSSINGTLLHIRSVDQGAPRSAICPCSKSTGRAVTGRHLNLGPTTIFHRLIPRVRLVLWQTSSTCASRRWQRA